jgi:trk system potassium uptake protein TrkA
MPSARQTDVFAGGQVQIVEFDVLEGANAAVVDRPLREAKLPEDSRVFGIIRGDALTLPRGDDTIRADDRIVVIGSPAAAREWGRLLAPGEEAVKDVVVFGGGQSGAR